MAQLSTPNSRQQLLKVEPTRRYEQRWEEGSSVVKVIVWLYSSFFSIFLLSHSCHIKMMTSLSVAVAGKRPDLWLKTVQVLLKMVGKEEKDEENEKNAESETVAIQSLIQLVSSYDSHNNKCQIYQLS